MRVEYTGRIRSPLFEGEARLFAEEDGLALNAPFVALRIPYAEISAFELRNYAVRIATDSGELAVHGLGYDCEGFYDELYAAYNQKVRKALFASGTPRLRTEGEYRYSEGGEAAGGRARIEVYGDCVLLLPPNEQARRIPLCFVTALEKGAYALTLRLDSGESCTFSKLGYDIEPFADALEHSLKALRKQALEHVKALDPALGAMQAAAIAQMMPEGVAVPLGKLSSIAPSFAQALERKVMESRAAESFAVLKTLCRPEEICVGIKKGFGWRSPGAIIDGETGEQAKEAQGAADAMVWMIAPARQGGVAAVEFAVEEERAAATYIYRFQGSFEAFAKTFNRALEAIAFRREVIRQSDADLKKPENADVAMAVRRNPALRLIRGCYAGRVIHASPESWKRGILEHFEARHGVPAG